VQNPRSPNPNPNPSKHTEKGRGQKRTYLVLLAPPTVGVLGTPVHRQDPARSWTSRGQGPREPPWRRSPCHRSGRHGDAARRWRAHPAVDARAGEGARRGAARSIATGRRRSLACSGGEEGGAGEERANELGFRGGAVLCVFDPPKTTHVR
jgi:hypothetical protein